jgi:predicted PurR-regulated permease PerM
MFDICPPALIYIVFSLTQIIIDMFQGMFNTAFMKLIVATMITILLDALCKRGLDVISWVIVFIPFIFMTVIVSVLLYIFGLNSDTGVANDNTNKQTPYTFSNGNLIFSSSSSSSSSNSNNSSKIIVRKDSYYNSANAPSLYESSDPYTVRLI